MKKLIIIILLIINYHGLLSIEKLYPEVEYVFDELDEYGQFVLLYGLLVDDNHLFAVSSFDIYFKNHKGYEWKQILNWQKIVSNISYVEIFQNRLIFTINDSLYLSNEDFTSFIEISNRLPSDTNISFYHRFAKDDYNLFVLSNNEVYRTTDSGANWNRIIDTAIKKSIFINFYNIFFNKYNHTLYIPYYLGYFSTSDYGQNWITPNDNLYKKTIKYFAFDNFFNTFSIVEILNFEKNYGIYKKKQNEELYLLKYTSKSRIWDIKTFDNLIIASTDTILIISQDEGETWKEYDVIIDDEEENHIQDYLIYDKKLYLVIGNHFLYSIGLDKITSIPDKNNSALSIYPNPSTNTINLRYRIETAGIVNIFLTDILGNKTLLKGEYKFSGDYVETFNLNVYPQGIYNIVLQSGDMVYSDRVLILR